MCFVGPSRPGAPENSSGTVSVSAPTFSAETSMLGRAWMRLKKRGAVATRFARTASASPVFYAPVPVLVGLSAHRP